MNARTILLLGIILICWIAPAAAQKDEPTGPEPELTDLYPPFDDGLPVEVLDVAALLSEAAYKNPELESRRDSWKIAQALIPQAQAVPDPVLSLDYGFDRPHFVHPGYVRVSVSQVLPGYGKIPAQTAVAELEVKVRRRLYEEHLNTIFTEIQRKLVELYLVESLIQIKRKHQFMVDHLIRVTTIKYSVGKGAQPDVVMAQTERTKFESELTQLWGQRKRVLARLKYLTGADTLPEGRAPVPLWPDEIELQQDRLLETARLYRPQLRALRTQIEKAEARKRLAETQDNPDVTLAIMSRWFQYQPDGIMLTASVPLPLFNRKRYQYAVIEQEREKEQAQSMLAEAEMLIEYGVGDKLIEIETAVDQYKITNDTLLIQARQLFQGSLKSYEIGEYDFLSLIQAQHTLQDIELALVKYQTDASLAFTEIEGLIGVVLIPNYRLIEGKLP